MDFGSILDKWEKQHAGNVFFDKDREFPRNVTGERRYRLLRKKPDVSIDLHGLTGDEAWAALEAFFQESFKKGFEKVLIIHGKGNHSDEGVLRDLCRRFVETCSFAGESGYSQPRNGGKGATWVILKRKGLPFPVNDSASREVVGG